jgi:hypothetical protein
MRTSEVHTEATSTAAGIAVAIVLLITLTAIPAAGTAAQTVDHPVDADPTAGEGAVDDGDRRVTLSAAAIQGETQGGSVGDVVDIDLRVPDGSSGRLYLGSRDVAYLTSVAFTDDGDGEVTLSVNTFLAGGHLGAERRAWSAEGGSVTNVTRHTAPLSDPLEPTVYDANMTVDGAERAVTPVPFRPASVDDVTTAVAPAGAFGEEPGTVESAQSGHLAVGDTLVANVTVSGVFGMLAAQPGETTTERFRSLVTGENASLEIRPGTTDADLALDRSFENDAFDVYADPDAQTLSVVTDTSALRYDGDAGELQAGERYRIVFVIESESDLSIEEAAWADDIAVRDRTATFETGENGTVRLPAASDAELSGTTALAPGTELEVETRADGAFLQHTETRVGEDGAFTASLNLSTVEPGTTFTAHVDDLDVETPGIVVDASERDAPPSPQTTTEGPDDTVTPGATAARTDGGNAMPTVAADTPETESTPTGGSRTGTEESGAGFGALAALLAVVALVGLTLYRRRTA